jgi:hypothetical protein
LNPRRTKPETVFEICSACLADYFDFGWVLPSRGPETLRSTQTTVASGFTALIVRQTRTPTVSDFQHLGPGVKRHRGTGQRGLAPHLHAAPEGQVHWALEAIEAAITGRDPHPVGRTSRLGRAPASRRSVANAMQSAATRTLSAW